MCSVGLGMGMNDDCEDGGADSAAATVDGEDQAKIRPASQPTPRTRLRSLQRCEPDAPSRFLRTLTHPQRKAFFFPQRCSHGATRLCLTVGGGPFKAKKIELWLEQGGSSTRPRHSSFRVQAPACSCGALGPPLARACFSTAAHTRDTNAAAPRPCRRCGSSTRQEG